MKKIMNGKKIIIHDYAGHPLKLLGFLKSNTTYRNIIYKPVKIKNKIDLTTINQLSEIFDPQIDRLGELINRDLNFWKYDK